MIRIVFNRVRDCVYTLYTYEHYMTNNCFFGSEQKKLSIARQAPTSRWHIVIGYHVSRI